MFDRVKRLERIIERHEHELDCQKLSQPARKPAAEQ